MPEPTPTSKDSKNAVPVVGSSADLPDAPLPNYDTMSSSALPDAPRPNLPEVSTQGTATQDKPIAALDKALRHIGFDSAGLSLYQNVVSRDQVATVPDAQNVKPFSLHDGYFNVGPRVSISPGLGHEPKGVTERVGVAVNAGTTLTLPHGTDTQIDTTAFTGMANVHLVRKPGPHEKVSPLTLQGDTHVDFHAAVSNPAAAIPHSKKTFDNGDIQLGGDPSIRMDASMGTLTDKLGISGCQTVGKLAKALSLDACYTVSTSHSRDGESAPKGVNLQIHAEHGLGQKLGHFFGGLFHHHKGPERQ